MIKAGIIGYGFSAQTFHIPLIKAAEAIELKAISSSQGERVRHAQPKVALFASAEELIQSQDVELAIITAPNDKHFSLAKAALLSGKHVVLEKPMATTYAEAQRLAELAEEKRLTLSVFHNRRWDADFLTVKKLIESHQLGDIRYFESHFDRHRPLVRERWKELPGPGGGVWYDLGSHLVDQAVQLFGLPDSLTAHCRALRDDSQATDYFHVTFHYSACEVVLHSSPYVANPNIRFQVQGTKGSFIKYDLDPQETQLKNNLTPNDPQFGHEAERAFGQRYDENGSKTVQTERGNYAAYYADIAKAIANQALPAVTAEEGAAVIKLLELAEQSSQTGRRLSVL